MNRTIVDWWSWRSKAGPGQVQDALASAFGANPVRLAMRDRGYMGYAMSAQVIVGDVDAGLCAWGGDNQRGWSFVSLSGSGCAWVEDWDTAQACAAKCPAYEPRRVDIALDTFDGSTGFDQTLAAYRAGGFSPAGSGRPPKCEPMKPEHEEDSAIIRIGSRASNKYLRGYEKGKQVVGPIIAALTRQSPGIDAVGMMRGSTHSLKVGPDHKTVPVWEWWRLELELKSQTAPLPEDVIDRRDQYFAGAYPYLGQVLPGVDAEPLVMSRERGPQLDLALALEVLHRQWGPTLFTALMAHGGDMTAVWDRIVGHKHNQRLVDAGVLMVEH